MKTSAFLTACLFISSWVSAQNIEWTKRIGFDPSANYQNIVTDDLNSLHLFYSVIDVHGNPLYSILRKYDPSGNLSSVDTLSLNAVMNYVERSNHSTFYITGFSGDSSLQIGGFFIGYGSFNAQLDFNNNWIDAHPLVPGASYLNDPALGVTGNETSLASYDLNGSSCLLTTAATSNEVVPELMTMNQNGSIYFYGFFQDSLFVKRAIPDILKNNSHA